MNKPLLLLSYDIECYPDLLLFIFKDYNTKEYHIFEYSKFKDDRKALYQFITSNFLILLSYNGKYYDDQMLYYFYMHPKKSLLDYKNESNQIINAKFNKYPEYSIYPSVIYQGLDLQEINNYGITSAKRTSLKMLAFNIRDRYLDDLPYPHDKPLIVKSKSRDKLDKVIKYCQHDTDKVEILYEISKPLIKYRREYGSLVGLNLLNYSETALAKKVIAKIFSEALEIDPSELKEKKVYRESIAISDVINYKEFYDNAKLSQTLAVYNYYNSKVLTATKDSTVKNTKRKLIDLEKALLINVEYPNGLKSQYGSGGIHGVVKPGVYISDGIFELWDYDFGSYYPHLIAKFKGLEPKHLVGLLGKQLMSWYEERSTKYPKDTHWDLNYALKIIVNLCYGLMGSEFSDLYDVQAQLGVCVNGMLVITKLTEDMFLTDGVEVLYQNTDGFMIRIDTTKTNPLAVKEHIEAFAKLIQIPIEYEKIQKFVLLDVNNFTLKTAKGKIKQKGRFETYSTICAHKDYHKNTSAMIIPYALDKYYHNDYTIDQIRELIYNHNNIFDFRICAKGNYQYSLLESNDLETEYIFKEKLHSQYTEDMRELEPEDKDYFSTRLVLKEFKNKEKNIITSKILNQRVIAYYIATEGSTLSKLWYHNTKLGTRFESLEANNPVIVCNNILNPDVFKEVKKTNELIDLYPKLDREYYFTEVTKIIKQIDSGEIEEDVVINITEDDNSIELNIEQEQ